MSTTTSYPFTTAGNYTYDSDLIEITGGVAQLKDQRPETALFYGDFDSVINLNWTVDNGTTTAATTGAGSCTIVNNKMKLDGAVTWSVTDYDNNPVNSGTIINRVTPHYSGTPAAGQNFLNLYKTGAGTLNTIKIQHDAAGNLNFIVYDNAGGNVTSAAAWSPTAETTYEITISFDWTVGSESVCGFVDGVKRFESNATGHTRSAADVLTMGSGSLAQNFSTDYFYATTDQLYDATYTPNQTIPATIYSTTNPTIVTNSTFYSTELATFAATVTAAGSDAVKFAIRKAGVDYYFSGTLQTSSSYTETNTAAEVNTNAASFLSARTLVGLKVYLHSDDGTTTPNIDIATFTYDAALPTPSVPTLVNIEGFLYGHGGALADTTVYIRPYDGGYFNDGVFHIYQWQELATSDADGHINGSVYLQGSGKYWELKIGPEKYYTALPDQEEVNWNALTLTESP